MKLQLGKPSPATAIALVSLFFSITGFGIAAKGLITGKDIKDGSVSSKDLAKGAVKAKNLAKGAVTADALAASSVTRDALAADSVTDDILAPGAVKADALGPDAVTGDAIAPDAVAFDALSDEATSGLLDAAQGPINTAIAAANICPNGVISVPPQYICPPTPNRYAEAQNVTSNLTVDVGGGVNCYIRTEVPFSSIKDGPGGGIVLDPATKIETREGVYTVTVNGTWDAGTGVGRALQIRKTIGSGPNAGNNSFVGQVLEAPASQGQTSQSLTAQVSLDFDDTVSLQVGSCGPDGGANIELDSVSLSMVQNIGDSN